MSVCLESMYTGGQLAAALSCDPEEFAYFLVGLSEDVGPTFVANVAEYFPFGADAEGVARLLRALADEIER
ncbi:hypothetical protein RGUI_0820 [Rhodovulum sp. P5]|uniref:hypothetical protein n=1 Tax=Rhodovulum phage vB_RhkS_P1 TaxID=1873452 RepID=UPI00080A9691|nr:hypothetical protein [Rhodovulum sp. P5]YP_009285905.1 hypothetical protein BI026_gp20 [Rhodovulum phage vB_RhkS_P1]ANT39890.1 hypothetical protein Rhks_20 [Rhodovulum phage vB_RhkS_P1]ARE38961.1 hypothetical protein RGUI_0820 [Rhodovulum sp. P5]